MSVVTLVDLNIPISILESYSFYFLVGFKKYSYIQFSFLQLSIKKETEKIKIQE